MHYALLTGGLAVLAVAWLGPLRELTPHTFFAHMGMHVAIVAVAAPLIAVGIAQTRLDPVRVLPRWFAPIPASVIELIVIWSWHTPAMHHIARHTGWGLVVEQAMFLFAALLVWLSAFGGEPEKRSTQASAGIIGLLLTSMHMTLLGALLTLAPRVLYIHDAEVIGINALKDQQIGGLLMLIGGGSVYLIGGLVLMAGLLRANTRANDQSGSQGSS